MNKSRLFRWIFLSVLAVGCAAFSAKFLLGEQKEEPYKIAVIVDDSNDDRWIAFRQGLEQAAQEFSVNLNMVSTGKLTDAEEEVSMLERELGSGVDGVIIQMISSKGLEEGPSASSYAEKIMLIESDVEPEGCYASVIADDSGIGKAIADCIIADFGEDLSDVKIGILSGNQQLLSMQRRLRAFTERIEDTNAGIVWTLDAESSEMLADTDRTEKADILVTLENEETEKAVDYLESDGTDGEKGVLYGEGISEKAVYYLDKGVIRWLVIPNEFYMGYRSVENLVRRLQSPSAKPEYELTDYLAVNRNTMYDEENQTIVFPIVQ